MKKLLLLCALIPALLSARLIVNQSELVLKSHLDAQVKQFETVIIKAFDADDEKGAALDTLIVNDKKLPLYKVTYDRMSSPSNWAGSWFGDDFMNRATVYQVYHKGKRVARLHPENYSSSQQFRKKITQLLQGQK